MSNMEKTLNILVKLTPHFFVIIGFLIIVCGIIVGIHNLITKQTCCLISCLVSRWGP